MKINGSQIVIEVLAEQGVDTVFGYPGGAILNIYDALYKNSDRIKHITTAHEQGAAHAADGYARATGKTGVVFATSGPGATNLVTGIATAFMDSVPVVAITANVASDLIGLDSFQEVYIAGITMPITKHNFVVRKVEELADTLREAFKIACSDRPGPVLVDITKDVTAAECEFTPAPKVQPVKHDKFTDEDIENAAKMINASSRPVVLYGGGVVSSGASDELSEFLNKGGFPCTNTLMGTAACTNAPLDLKMLGHHGYRSANMAVAESDLVIAVGTRFSDRVATNKKKFATKAKVIHIDIDSAEINKNVSSSYSLVGDVAHVLKALLPHVEKKERKEWLESAVSLKSDYVTAIKDTAAKCKIGVCTTFLSKTDDKFQNTAIIVDRNGNIILNYAKVHTCDFSLEKLLQHGNEFKVCDFDGVQIGVMICYDREFPESARLLML